MKSTIAPWITVQNSKKAIDFYEDAFGAEVVYRLDGNDEDIVARLSVDGAEFWLSNGSDVLKQGSDSPCIRFILTVPDPDAVFGKALNAGAREIYPVGEEHGWRLGRLEDPFGIHWEIGHPSNP